jgi:hypothetical protein
MLLDEAQKLYNKLVKDIGDEIISDYASNISSSSLPLLSPLVERQSHHIQTASIQSNRHTGEHRFVLSEIDNEDQDK